MNVKRRLLIIFSIVCVATFILAACQNTYQLHYTADFGGRIEGSVSQSIEDGESGTEVTAIADVGYLFSGWSDGVETATRIEENVHSNISVKAHFTKISYVATYQTTEGGSIVGESVQTTSVGEMTTTVTAVAAEGYLFKSWSDGLQSAERKDKISYTFRVTAFFVHAKYQANYSTWPGGYIEGLASQEAEYGRYALPVTAIAEEGYYFRDWSDGVKTATRKDLMEKDIEVTACFLLKKVTVNYLASEGGSIQTTHGGYGATQTVPYWGGTNPVMPVADYKYEFVMWSDGVTEQSRQDENLRGDLTVTAIFKRIEYVLNYAPNKGGRVIGNLNQSIYKTEDGKSVTAIADEGYEFVCWSDGETTPIRSDTYVMYDIDVKATFAPIDVATFQVLMVYVDELCAVLATESGQRRSVNYKMSEIERQFCGSLTKRLSGYLNNLFQGSVRFIVDEYFTTKMLDNTNMRYFHDNFGNRSYYINADNIPEVCNILSDYRSVLTTFGMNDFDYRLHSVGGSAVAKFGNLHMESNLEAFLKDNYEIRNFLDPDLVDQNYFWDAQIESYLHEFTHTVQHTYYAYDFHAALSEFSKEYGAIHSSLQVSAPYLTNTLVLKGEIIGIAPVFWSSSNTLTYTEGLEVYRFGIPLESGATIYYGDRLSIGYPASREYDLELEMIAEEGFGTIGQVIYERQGWGYHVRNSDVQLKLHIYPK